MILGNAVVLAAAMGLATPALALVEDSSSDTAAATAAKADLPEEKLICKKRNFNTGSHMRPKPECRTAADWKERETAAKRELQRLRDKHQTHGMGEGR